MNHALTSNEVLAFQGAPEHSLGDAVRSMARAVVEAARTLPEFATTSFDTFPLADGIVYSGEGSDSDGGSEAQPKRTEIPAENPDDVKKRDGIQPDTITPRGQPQAAPGGSGSPSISGRKGSSGSASREGDRGKKRK